MQNVVVYSFCQSFVLPFSFIPMSVVDNSCFLKKQNADCYFCCLLLRFILFSQKK